MQGPGIARANTSARIGKLPPAARRVRKASAASAGIVSLVVGLGIVLCTPRSASAQSSTGYTFTTIDASGPPYTIAYGINNARHIVGYSENIGAFLYIDGKFTTIQ